MTKAEIMKKLDELNVKHDKDMKKNALEALLVQAAKAKARKEEAEEVTEEPVEEVEESPEVPEEQSEEEAKASTHAMNGKIVMKRNVKHNGTRYRVGEEVVLSTEDLQHFVEKGWV